MNAAQIKTVKGIAIFCGLQVIAFAYLLVVEIAGAASDNAAISPILWRLWAYQPWVIFIVTHILAAPWWYLLGHFTAQSKSVYDAIRAGRA